MINAIGKSTQLRTTTNKILNTPDIGPRRYATAARTSTLIPNLVSQALTPDSTSASSTAPAPPACDVLNVGTPPDW